MNRFPALACWLLIASSAAAAEPVRVATWNLGDGGVDDQQQIRRALELFADTADVIALQECASPCQPLTTGGASVWHSIYEHSNAILSRWPIVQSGLVAANPAWARDLPWADIQPPAGPAFRIYSVHLTFKRDGNPLLGAARAVEVRRILLHARSFAGPVILAGDLNTIGWILGGQSSEPAIKLLHASGYADAFHAVGGRTHAVLGRLDWIYARGFAASDPVLGDYDHSDHRWLRVSLTPSDAIAPQPAARFDGGPLALLTLTALALWGLIARRRRKMRSVG